MFLFPELVERVEFVPIRPQPPNLSGVFGYDLIINIQIDLDKAEYS